MAAFGKNGWVLDLLESEPEFIICHVTFDVEFSVCICRGGKVSVKGSSKSRQLTDDEESEGLALLIPDIQETARIVSVAVHRILDKSSKLV